MYEYLDRRYAVALYKIASAKNKTEEYITDLRPVSYTHLTLPTKA